MEYINIFYLNSLSCLILILNGISFKKILNFQDSSKNLLEAGLYGIIFVSLTTFISNFFFKISSFVSIIILFLPIIFTFKEIIYKKKKIIFITILLGAVSSLIMYFDNTNRPDAGLYHLPFIKIINESKIIIGSANLEFRYGHTSILQYLSAAFNNLIFSELGILLPLANIFSIAVFYLLELIKKNNNLLKVIFFIFLFNILYSMNRYSGFGNDDPGHIFYFLAVCNFLYFYIYPGIDKIKNILFFSLFAFLIKPFLILIFIFPLILLIDKKIQVFTKINIFCLLIVLLWFFKNILISSCAIYPVAKTCIKNLEWTTYKSSVSNPERVSRTSEAWAKDWPNKKKDINQSEYIKNFNWLDTWKDNHFRIFINEIIPQIVLIITLIILSTNSFNKKINLNLNLKLILIGFFSFALWFLKFPIYRYGHAYIISFINFLFLFYLTSNYKIFNFKEKFIFKFINYTLILLIIGIAFKNVNRIYSNLNTKYYQSPWPKMYSFTETNKKNQNLKINSNEGELLYYKPFPYSLCMYSSSPCTSNLNVGDIRKKNILGYTIYLY